MPSFWDFVLLFFQKKGQEKNGVLSKLSMGFNSKLEPNEFNQT